MSARLRRPGALLTASTYILHITITLNTRASMPSTRPEPLSIGLAPSDEYGHTLPARVIERTRTSGLSRCGRRSSPRVGSTCRHTCTGGRLPSRSTPTARVTAAPPLLIFALLVLLHSRVGRALARSFCTPVFRAQLATLAPPAHCPCCCKLGRHVARGGNCRPSRESPVATAPSRAVPCKPKFRTCLNMT